MNLERALEIVRSIAPFGWWKMTVVAELSTDLGYRTTGHPLNKNEYYLILDPPDSARNDLLYGLVATLSPDEIHEDFPRQSGKNARVMVFSKTMRPKMENIANV